MLIAKNSSRYGTHSMACLGYRKYSYTSGWWIFSSTKTAYLFNVDDGQSFQRYNAGESVWYDPEAYSSSLETFYVYDHLN